MRDNYTILFFLMLTIFVSGQENGLRTKLIDQNYTWRTVSHEQLNNFYFDLQPIQSTKFKSHFRISLTGQIIDIYSYDNKKYQGKLTNYSTQYVSVNSNDTDYHHSKEYQYLIELKELEQDKVEDYVQNFINSGQLEVPTDTLITSWQRNFLHCKSIIIQFNINGEYTKQTLYCPWGQKDNVEFKNIIIHNYETLKSIFQLESLYDDFTSKLPKGKTYSRDGYRMMYKLTDQQRDNWAKFQPQMDFLKSVKDTVDNFLNSELGKQNIKLNELDCFEDFQLTFGTNGKLKRVSVLHYDKPKLKNSFGLSEYLAEKREIRHCIKKIKEIFSTIDLSFLNLEYKFYRIFSFDHEGEYELRDSTIY